MKVIDLVLDSFFWGKRAAVGGESRHVEHQRSAREADERTAIRAADIEDSVILEIDQRHSDGAREIFERDPSRRVEKRQCGRVDEHRISADVHSLCGHVDEELRGQRYGTGITKAAVRCQEGVIR